MSLNNLKDKYIVLLEKLEIEKELNNKLNDKIDYFTNRQSNKITTKTKNINTAFLKSVLNDSLNIVYKDSTSVEDSDDEYDHDNIYIRIIDNHTNNIFTKTT